MLLRKIGALLGLFKPMTFSRQPSGGGNTYRVFNRADWHYYLVILPFLLAFFGIIPGVMIYYLAPGIADAPTFENQILRIALTALAVLIMSGPFWLFTLLFAKETRESLDVMESFYTEFTVSPDSIELKNTPDACLLRCADITEITLRDVNKSTHYDTPGKIYKTPRKRPRANFIKDQGYEASDGFFDLLFPPTYSVDIETHDRVFSLTRGLVKGKALALARHILEDAQLKNENVKSDGRYFMAQYRVARR